MQYKIEVRPLAAIEIIEAYDWYEQQREGLGMKFLNELDIFYSRLLRNPNTYSYYDEPRERSKNKSFPLYCNLCIFYHHVSVLIGSRFPPLPVFVSGS